MVKTLQPVWVSANFAQVLIDDRVEFGDIRRSEVGHPVVFQVFPESFDRIEVRSIGRQAFQPQARKAAKQVPDGIAFVHRSTVPHHDDPTAQVSQQRANKSGRSLVVDVLLGIAAEVQRELPASRRQAQGRAETDLVALPGSLSQNGCTTARCKRSTHQWGQQDPAFIDQDEVRFEPGRFF